MLATVTSASMFGIDAVPVKVEVDIAGGSPGFATVGLPENSVREARVRVESAIGNSGFAFPDGRITVNLAPANVKKEGTGFDLPIALGIMAAGGMFSAEAMHSSLFLGELSLTGEVKPVRGVLSAAVAARKRKVERIFVAAENAQEAALLGDIEVRSVKHFNDLIQFFRDGNESRVPKTLAKKVSMTTAYLDLSDVRGQFQAKRALEIAAAGGHNLLFCGGPGAGKSMMAQRLPSILPPMTHDEALEVTRVFSAAGQTLDGKLISERPFRAPHHTTTRAGLVGGGNGIPRPGELSMASHGVLFLDELPEFSRFVLEVLRQPLESKEVTLSRANGTIHYPANFMLVAAMNPCPCGYFGQKVRKCKCSGNEVARYKAKLSGPLLDRIDLHVDVPPVEVKALETLNGGESSEQVRNRVVKARAIQEGRYISGTNASVQRNELIKHGMPDEKGKNILALAHTRLGLSARSYDRILRIARTIADLEGATFVNAMHISEAIDYRGQTKP